MSSDNDDRLVVEKLTLDEVEEMRNNLCDMYNKIDKQIESREANDTKDMIFNNIASMYLQSMVKHDHTHSPLSVEEFMRSKENN